MVRYPVYRALYRPMTVAGVPLLLLMAEIVFSLLFICIGLYLAIIPVAAIHAAVSVALKHDPFCFLIILDVLTLRDNRRTTEGREEA